VDAKCLMKKHRKNNGKTAIERNPATTCVVGSVSRVAAGF
jgi:hypothetical protein